MTHNDIARTCHEVNRAYCYALGDHSQPAWYDAPEWQRASARMGVDLHTMGNFGPESSHISWMRQKEAEGWVYGPIKDPEAKQHPCMVPFAQLPVEQQAKDFIFRAVVHALRGAAPVTLPQSIEAKIQAKGLNAPRLTPAALQDNIEHVEFVKHISKSGQVLRWAVLTTRNGFAVTGRPSASVSPENDHADIGEEVALDNATQELWPLMGYALKERLHAASINPAEED